MDFSKLVDEIRSRVDIVEIIKDFVELKRSGQNWKGLCPFHPEKTPSFMVSPSKQIFHCFGCNKGGDVFSFIMSYENISFTEAVRLVAQKIGIELTNSEDTSEYRKSQKEKIFSINKEALNYFRKCLSESKQALFYLRERGVKDESIEKFSLGFTNSDKDALFNHLTKAGFELEDIKLSGLVVFSDAKYQDFFKKRIIFPIFDLRNRCVGFGGRTLLQMKEVPKYINSPDTLVFRKGEICFGLNFAKSSISQKGYSMIVEGYFDTIMSHQFGFDNTVSPLGTALTIEQLKKIKRLANKILLVFDGDSAGISAAKRTLELIFSEAMIAKVLMLPTGEDPDSFFRKYGSSEMIKYMGQSKKPIEFILSLYPKDIIEGVKHTLSMISLCPDLLIRDKSIKELSEISKLDELTLRQELVNLAKKNAKLINKHEKKESLQNVTQIKNFIDSNKEEETLLKVVLLYPNYYSKIIAQISGEKIDHSLVKNIFHKIGDILSNAQEFTLERLLQVCTSVEQQLITKLMFTYYIEPESIDKIIKDCIKGIEIREIEKQIKKETDVTILKRLFLEKRRLISQKN